MGIATPCFDFVPEFMEEPSFGRPATAQDEDAAATLALLQPPERQIVVGICAMTKKSKSKPMTQILERLCKFEYIAVVIMGEDVILNEPVEKWPACDCLVSFHSKGWPVEVPAPLPGPGPQLVVNMVFLPKSSRFSSGQSRCLRQAPQPFPD